MRVEDIDEGSDAQSDAEERSDLDSGDADSAEEYQPDVGDNDTGSEEDRLVDELDLIEEVVVSANLIPVASLHNALNVHR